MVDLPSVRWLTGFTGSNGLAVISAEAVVLATDGRYATQAPAQLEAAGSDATVVIASDLVASGADVLRGAARVALEGDVISWDQQRQWAAALADSELVAVSGLLRELRSVKDPSELAASRRQRARRRRARRHGDAADARHDRAAARACARRRHAGRGASGPAYETIVAPGPNAALPHARPSDRAFEAGDLLIVDVGRSSTGIAAI